MKYAWTYAALAMAAAPASAEENRYYAQVGAAWMPFDGTTLANPGGDYNVGTLSASVGHQEGYFAGEIDLDIGVKPGEASNPFLGTDDEVSVGVLSGFFLRAGYNPTDKVYVFARAGFMAGVMKVELEDRSGVFEESDEVYGHAFGFGATYDISDQTYLRFDVTSIDMVSKEDFDVEASRVALSYGYRFN